MNQPTAINFPAIVERTFAELKQAGGVKSISQDEAMLLAEILWNNRFDGDIDMFERAVSEVLKAKVNFQ